MRKRFLPTDPVIDGKQHYEYRELRKENGAVARIAIARATGQGHSAALLATKNAIDDLCPEWVVFVGIAGAVPDSEFTLGDVLLADHVHDFSITATTDGGRTQLRPGGGSLHRAVERLLTNLPARRSDLAEWATEAAIGSLKPMVVVPDEFNAECFYGLPEEREKLRDLLHRHFVGPNARRVPIFAIGSIATANVLVKDTAILRRWKDAARHITHIEMEFGGAYYAARREDPEMPLLSVRGISDVIGFNRSDEWTQYACDAAASFLYTLIRVLPNEAFAIRRRTLEASTQALVSRFPRPWQRLINVSVGSVTESMSYLAKLITRQLERGPTVETIIEAFRESSAPLVSRVVDPEHRLPRSELRDLKERFSSEAGKVICVLGGPGSGKTALLALLAQSADNDGTPTLAFKADLLPKDDPFEHWGLRHIGKDISAVDAVRVLAARGRVLVVVDQLDALSTIVAVSSSVFNLVVGFIRECAAIPHVCVVCSCREFDFYHDARFTALNADTLVLVPPTWDNVVKQLERHGITGAEHWPKSFRDLLHTPQHLRVFLDRFAMTGRTDVHASYHLMLDDLWARAVVTEDERLLLDSLTAYLMEHEQLWAPLALFSARRSTVNELKRKGVLEVHGMTVGFSHQTLLEHAKARYFTTTTHSFSKYVQDHESTLQVRPTVWSVLEYLRSAHPDKYRDELDNLFAARLRLHLRYLLVDFLGQCKALHDREKALMGARLMNSDDCIRALVSIVGNFEWFDTLRGTHFPTVMLGKVEVQWPMVGVINAAWQHDHDSCFSLINDNWLPEPQKDALTRRVLSETDRWGSGEQAMAIKLIRRSQGSGERLLWAEWLVYKVSELAPEMAPTLFVEAMSRLGDSVPHSLIETGQYWYELVAVAEAAPDAFLRAAWDWFVSHCERYHGGPASSVLYMYEGYSLSLDDDSQRPQPPVLAAFLLAVERTAQSDPETFVDITKGSWASENAVVHRMLIRGLTTVVKSRPDIGLEYLAGDRRRFQVGSHYSERRSDSMQLITALALHLGVEGLRQLESLIVGWSQYRDEHDVGGEQTKWDREARLNLLNAIPPEFRSPTITALVDNEKLELPGWDRQLPKGHGGFVHEVSPISKDDMIQISDEEIVDAICRLREVPRGERRRTAVADGWEEPGGPRAAGRQLAELNKEDPLKVASVIRQLVKRGQDDAASYAFQGLADSSLTRDQAFTFARDIIALKPKSTQLRQDIAYVLYRRAARPYGLPEDLCATISGWLAEAASATNAVRPQKSGNDNADKHQSSVLWGSAGRSVSLEIKYPFWLLLAITSGYLKRVPPAMSAWLHEIESWLSGGFPEEVWASICSELDDIRFARAERELAQKIVVELFRRYPLLRQRKEGAVLLANVSEVLPQDELKAILADLRTDNTGVVRQAYGELITLIAFRDSAHHWASTSLEAELAQLIGAAQADQAIAVGIAYAAANLWDETDARPKSVNVLTRLIPIINENIGTAISTVFWSPQDFAVDEHTEQLLNALAENVNSLHHIAIADLVPHLVPLAPHMKKLVLSICHAIVESRNDDNRLFEVGPDLVSISMTLQRFNETRADALTLFENLLRLGLDAAFYVLQEIDIRPSRAIAPQYRIRRRRRSMA